MATKLDNITGQYHSYVEDQVLTHYQLNETIDYFSDQDRLSRVFLTGTGIACGFVVSISPTNNAITITQGTGITTDGDLIKLQKKTTDELALVVKQKLFTIDFSSITYKSYKPYTEDKGNYEHFKINPTTLVPFFELIPEKPAEVELEAGEQLLTVFPDLANIRNYVVLLYLESYPKEASLCSQIDCSNQGGEEVFNLRVLITTKFNANTIISKDNLYKKYDYFNDYQLLPELGVKKVIPTFNTIQSSNQIKQLFNAIISDNTFKNLLKNGILTMLTKLGYNTQAATINTAITNLFTILPASIPNDIHYRYNLLKDIVTTYKELKDLFIQLTAECNPPLGSFPKHLLLGVVVDNELHKSYRHQFYKAPILDNQNKTFSNFDALIQRLLQMTQKYGVVATANNVKITPSKEKGKLGQKSIPYYYSVDNSFINSWDFERSTIFIPKANFSYHTTNLMNTDFIQSPLKYTLEDYDFYRIEGYLNDSVDDVSNNLTNQKKINGLDFDFQIMDIIENKDDLKTLLNNNPSFEHKAGVKKGGTLLLLKQGTTFITDFAVDYKITAQEGLSCCAIVESFYPWISSLKYINNLARSLNGTQSANKAMPTHYVLNVKRYSINGVNLITSPVQIRIPILGDLFLRRLHVVMEMINQRFPTGLVFDFIEEQKKLKILKLEKDVFLFEVQDITLGLNSPTYTYTQSGLIRNGRIFRNATINSSVINTHDEGVYKKLQSNYAPINKDDDNFGRFNSDWKRWESLKSVLRTHPVTASMRRFVTEFEQFSTIPNRYYSDGVNSNVKRDLQEIAEDIYNIDDRLDKIYIGGDWTDGNWVNSSMYNHYYSNLSNTNDAIVQFINLRQKLHNENGISKYMIHIETRRPNGQIININLEQMQVVFNRYAIKADFYLQKPADVRDGNFIEIIKASDEI